MAIGTGYYGLMFFTLLIMLLVLKVGNEIAKKSTDQIEEETEQSLVD